MQYVFYVPGLLQNREQTGNGTQKGNTFYEGRSQDHVCTNVVRSFRLTGNGINSALTDLADTDTGTYGSEACAEGAIAGLNHISQ